MSGPSSTEMFARFLTTFRDEANDLLRDLEDALLALESGPSDPELVATVFRALHTLKGSGGMFGLNRLVSVAHGLESSFEQVRRGDLAVTPQLITLGLQGKDLIRALVESGDAGHDQAIDDLRVGLAGLHAVRRLTLPSQAAPVQPQALSAVGAAPPYDPEIVAPIAPKPACTDSPGKIGKREAEPATDVLPEANRPTPVVDAGKPPEPGGEGAHVRVAVEKLDGLVNRVGELMIAQSRLSQVAGGLRSEALYAVAEEVERLSFELRDSALNLRMVPIRSTFGKFKRLVRDLSAQLGKQVEVTMAGAETELDKSVIERLSDPLVHLIRNSVDHGLETPDIRVRCGKPPMGQIRLSAYHSGSNVVIEVQDDGAGLDAVAIRERAVARNLIAADTELTEPELFSLIFVPGFSTAKTISDISGRGVGLDVVKRSIEALRGTVGISSLRRAGTTVRIRLPLTLAIIDGLLVSVGESTYVLPTEVVEECVELTQDQLNIVHGARLVPVRGELVPYVRLREWFGAEGPVPPSEVVAITRVDGWRLGIAVDEVVGQHQTVIKTIGQQLGDKKGLSGATVLGDGTVALIVDVARILRKDGLLGERMTRSPMG